MLILFAHDQLVIGHIRSSTQVAPIFYDRARSKRYENPPNRILAKSISRLIPNLTSGKKLNRNQNKIMKETDKP